jgi:hypothetical protein
MLAPPTIVVSEKSARTILEFCQRNSISRALFYKLKHEGKGPRIAYAGCKPIITAAAEHDWLLACEAAAANKVKVK